MLRTQCRHHRPGTQRSGAGDAHFGRGHAALPPRVSSFHRGLAHSDPKIHNVMACGLFWDVLSPYVTYF